jgi:hypothetical protein
MPGQFPGATGSPRLFNELMWGARWATEDPPRVPPSLVRDRLTGGSFGSSALLLEKLAEEKVPKSTGTHATLATVAQSHTPTVRPCPSTFSSESPYPYPGRLQEAPASLTKVPWTRRMFCSNGNGFGRPVTPSGRPWRAICLHSRVSMTEHL